MTVSLGAPLPRYSVPNSTRNSTGSRIEKASAVRSLKYPRSKARVRLRNARKFAPEEKAMPRELSCQRRPEVVGVRGLGSRVNTAGFGAAADGDPKSWGSAGSAPGLTLRASAQLP